MDDTERKESAMFDITSLDTYVLLGMFINILSAQAWQHMGLRVKPGTEKVERDIERAKTAIDCIACLIEKLEPYLQGDETKRLRNLLADLQINFARSMT